ncbi:MAG: 2'-5' RNA ligase family protein [Asgard group archaeon]|nr:2'-5' RNA ligase family protein [Asgard group archaeon]
MYRILVHYPRIDTTKIEDFRRKYDFTYDVIRAHITIVFPCDEKVTEEEISDHIKTVLEEWEPFEVTLEDFTLSKDYWLFLTMTKGNDTVIQLYKDLYQGILEPYSQMDLFIPHIGVGYFARKEDQSDFESYGELLDYKEKIVFDEQKYQDALSEAKNLNLVYPITIDEFTLVDLNKTFTLSKDVETILL